MSTDLATRVDELAAAVGFDYRNLNSQLANSGDQLDVIIDLLSSNGQSTTVSSDGVISSGQTSVVSASSNPIYGMCRKTGKLITQLEHLWQSIRDILLTRFKTVCMLRNYGSGIPDRVDAPMNQAWFAGLYIDIAEALDAWEPRFSLKSIQTALGEYEGQPIITLTGEASF